MKSSVLIILASLLATAILAPSVITLANIEEQVISIDLNEEEKNEEKKEAKEKDFFLDFNRIYVAQLEGGKALTSCFHIESDYSASIAVLLPPPELIF